jgi:hypothetical protein
VSGRQYFVDSAGGDVVRAIRDDGEGRSLLAVFLDQRPDRVGRSAGWDVDLSVGGGLRLDVVNRGVICTRLALVVDLPFMVRVRAEREVPAAQLALVIP